MRRALVAVAVLLTAAASPSSAGYLIIRVILDGSGGGGAVSPEYGDGYGGLPGPGTMLGPRAGMGGYGPPTPGGPAYGGYGPMAGGTTTPTAKAEVDHTRSVVVVIPLEGELKNAPLNTKRPYHERLNPAYRKFVVQHHGQKLTSALFVDSSTIQLYNELLLAPTKLGTRGTQVKAQYDAWARDKKDPQQLYDAILSALQHGFVPNAVAWSDELLAVAAEGKLTLPRDAQKFVAAWGQMVKAVKAPAPKPNDAETWKVRLDARDVRTQGHHSIISWDSSPAELARRATQLKDNFDAFFLWHATRGVALPVPDKPLVVVLADQGRSMRRLMQALDGLPAQGDAFYAPDHGLLVLSPERLDAVGQTFLRQNHQVFVKGLNRDRLLLGDFPPLDDTGEKGVRPEEVARASTLSVVEKLAVNEWETADVSREGTRQLLHATGQLPRHVTLPNWLTNGAVNFFTRPRGPAYVAKGDDDKPYMTVSFTTGYGVPNYVLQRYFLDMSAKKELNADSARLLENVLTDSYFAGIKDGLDPDPAPPAKKKKPAAKQPPVGGMLPEGQPPGPGGGLPGPVGPGATIGPPGPGSMLPGTTPSSDYEDPIVTLRKKRERLAIKSQATAWALYYYLARSDKSGKLKQYIDELNQLPRDLPIDGKTALAVFVRVFELSSADGAKADPQKMKEFADGWLSYMSTVPVVGIDVPLVVPEPPKTTPNMNPGGMPGGMPGMGAIP